MQKRFIRAAIILLVLHNNSSYAIREGLYNFGQNIVEFFLNLVPGFADHDNNDQNNMQDNIPNNLQINNQKPDITKVATNNDTSQNNDNGANNVHVNENNNNEILHRQVNQEEIKKDFKVEQAEDHQKWVKLIEMHYVWCAFMGTALNKINNEETNNNNVINLDSKVSDFFKEPTSSYESTLEKLKTFFNDNNPPYENNFIIQQTKFIDFIGNSLEKINDGVLKQIINSLLSNLDTDDKKNALWWIFTVTLGTYYQNEMVKIVQRKIDNGFYEADINKKRSAQFIVKSFNQRVILYQKFIRYFKLLHQLYNSNINENFIQHIKKHMETVLKGNTHYTTFINLMYRNKNRKGEYIDLVGNIL